MPQPEGPETKYRELFTAVQTRRIFRDSKTFVDAVPKSAVADILDEFAELEHDDDAVLRAFVGEHFRLPLEQDETASADELPIRERIEQLWDVLSRAADRVDPHSSLIPLPRPYVVPGGRFREVYYWDSYFTMLGLAEAGRFDMIEDMVENFAWLIDRIGFIPNGNRSYFCTRSQPPFFVLMVELLAEVRNDASILQRYLPQLQREYAFWMSGSDGLQSNFAATRRVVRVDDGFLNRYWDDAAEPRAESYVEDVENAATSGREVQDYYRNVRAACESGWDFSSRWLQDPERLGSIVTIDILPVDLNALLYRLETRLAEFSADETQAQQFASQAAFRKQQMLTRFFDAESGFFFDLDCKDLGRRPTWSLAAAYPLFFEMVTTQQAERVAAEIHARFLSAGGWLTTLNRSGQQWDRPNGWAPLQWIVYQGFRNYGLDAAAKSGAERWVADNLRVFERTGRLLEKYDVERVDALATGGEYVVQDGFGWTNGVLLKFMNQLGID